MNVFETAFWAIRSLKKPAAEKAADPAPDESQTQFFARTADLTPGIPHYNKGMILERRGEKQNAIDAYREATRAVPHYFDAHANLTRLLCEAEQWDEAIKHGAMAVRLKRNSPRVHNNLSVAFYHKGEVPKALHHSLSALQLAPGDTDLFENFTQIRKAHPELEKSEIVVEATNICRQLAEKHYEDGFALLKEKKITEAVALWRLTVRMAPTWADPICNLASMLATYPDATIRNPKDALDLALKAMSLGDGSHHFHDALAAAYANCGRFLEAQRTVEAVLPALKAKGPFEAAERFSERLKLYMAQKPLRQELPVLRPASRPGQP